MAQTAGGTPPAGQGSPAALVSPAEELKLPDTAIWLGSVQIPRRVTANGQTLAPGRYRVRLTTRHAEKDVVGQTEQLERWVEFVQGGEVKGSELAPVVPAASVPKVAEQRPPAPGEVRVQALRPEDKLLRLWFNHRGDQVLVYLPFAA